MALSLPAVDWAEATLDGHVLDVVLCGTGSGNRLGPAFWDEAPAFFSALDREDDVREYEAYNHSCNQAWPRFALVK